MPLANDTLLSFMYLSLYAFTHAFRWLEGWDGASVWKIWGGCIILNLQCYTHDLVHYCCGSMPFFSVGLHHVWSSQCLQLHHVTNMALSLIYVGPCPAIVLGYLRF